MTQTNSNRIKWIDMAKGIAMLMVIAGHSIGYKGTPFEQQVIRGIFYSFHMPLFFMLNGYTSRCPDSGKQLLAGLKKSFKRLIIPAYILWFVLLLFPVSSKFHHTPLQLALSALYASAVDYKLNDITIPYFGFIWFLVSLFVLKNLYDLINYILKGKFMTWVSLGFSVIGVIVGKKLFLPFVIDISMASMIFYHVGKILKNKELVFSAKKLCIAFVIWIGIYLTEFLGFRSYLDLASRGFSLVPLTYIAAIAGSLTCIYVCMYLCERRGRIMNFFTDQISFIGLHSMTLYAIHYLDMIWFSSVLILTNNQYLHLLVRAAEDVGLLYVVVYMMKKFRERKKEPGSKNAQ